MSRGYLLLFSCWVVSKSLWFHGMLHVRLSYPPLSPWVCSNSCSLSQWCYLTISISVTTSFCLQSFPASGSFPVNWLFASGGQSIFSISASNEYSRLISFGTDWFDILSVQGTLKSFLQHHNLKASILQHSAFFMVQHNYWKNHSFVMWTFVSKVMSLLFNMLSTFAITFLPRSKCLLISWLQVTVHSNFGA